MSEHVCGLRGYDPSRDPMCPACVEASENFRARLATLAIDRTFARPVPAPSVPTSPTVERDRSAQTLLPSDDPRRVAWEAYRNSDDYPNTKKWATYPEHTDGSLWAAFIAGWESRPAAPPSVLPTDPTTSELLVTPKSVVGPAVSPEIDALLGEEFDAWWEYGIWKDSSTTNKIENPFKFDRIDAARAALREAFRTLQANWDFASQSWTQEVDALNETVESLRTEVARLSEERDRLHGIINGCPRCQTENAFQYTTSKLRRGSAHKEKE